MRKKYLSALLFGALLFASTGTFTSCKDYDDDIDNLQTQITENANAIAKLQELMGQGQFVTGVSKTGEGLVFTMSNGGSSITIPVVDGQDGADGTIITMDPTTHNWIIDGVDTGICAQGQKGDKGDQGEQGPAGADGQDGQNGQNGQDGKDGHSPQIDAATGCWKVWDDEAQEWVVTDQSAVGAQTYVVTYENYYELNVMEQDAQGNNLGFKSIKLPMSGTLLSITPELNGQSYAQDFNIYYGILTSDVEWKGHKAENGKMLAGMYPTMDRDIKMQLNPSDVDANDYAWEFVDTENIAPWGLSFGAPEVWAGGKATVATRAITSANGLWALPRDVQRVDLNSAEMQGRPDYVTQFKANDDNKYLFALKGTSKVDGKSVKSPFVYTFKANNVNSVDNINLDGRDIKIAGKTFVYNKEYTPTFDMLGSSSNDYATWAEDSALVYDYYLTIDETKITKESIRKYGLEITPDGYRFIAKNEAVVNNTIPFVYHYILINGQTGSCTFSVSFNDEEVTVDNKYIGEISSKFDAEYNKATGLYEMSKTLSLDEFFKGLGESGKMKWIDALARNWNAGVTTDPQEARMAIFDKRYGSNDTDYAVELTGGDPINNQGLWDVASYNGYLLNNYIDFDYVDANGNSCLTGNIQDLEKITALKVTFKVNPNMGTVSAPYYTVNDQKWNGQTAALPLDNAFRVEIATRADQVEVSKMNFTFELTMPDCPITRVKSTNDDKSVLWAGLKIGDTVYDYLRVYGEQAPTGETESIIYGDLRDAFTGAFDYKAGKYTATAEAGYYNIYVAGVDQEKALLGQTNTANNSVTLDYITANSLWSEWNTWQYLAKGGSFATMEANKVVYNHYGVYEEELPKFYVGFASKIEDSYDKDNGHADYPKYNQVSGQTGVGTEASPLMAQPVYSGTTLTHYEIVLTDANFELKDAFGYTYKLFDSVTVKDGKATDTKKRNAINNMWANDREGIDDNATMYGLNPTAKVDGQATTAIDFTLQTWNNGTWPTDGQYATKLKIEIPESVAAAKNNLVEVTLNITDVFGHTFPLKVYIQTVK